MGEIIRLKKRRCNRNLITNLYKTGVLYITLANHLFYCNDHLRIGYSYWGFLHNGGRWGTCSMCFYFYTSIDHLHLDMIELRSKRYNSILEFPILKNLILNSLYKFFKKFKKGGVRKITVSCRESSNFRLNLNEIDFKDIMNLLVTNLRAGELMEVDMEKRTITWKL